MTEAPGQTGAAMVTGAVAAETAIIEETLQVQTRMPLATIIIASLAMWMHIAYSALCFLLVYQVSRRSSTNT